MKVSEIMTENPVIIDAEETFSKAMSKMSETGIHQIPVLDDKKYIGMISYSDLLKKRSIQVKSKISNFATSTPVLQADDDVLKAVKLIKDNSLSAIPVFKNNRLVGIVSRTDVVKNIDKIADVKDIQAFQIMTSDPVYVNEDDTIDEAFDDMKMLNQSEIPVVNKNEELSGIISINSIISVLFRDKEKIKYGGYAEKEKVEITCASVMDNPVSVDRYADIKTIATTMAEHRIHLIPVTDSRKIIGIVDYNDIIDVVKTENKEGILIEVSGLDVYDDDLYSAIFDTSDRFLQKFSKITGITQGKLHIQVMKYKTQGAVKYSVRTRISAPPLFMAQNGAGWNFVNVLSEIFDTYIDRVVKNKER
ncbi:MAG: CBS domain-containing protein [Thermoplasmata archaeon]